VIARRARHDAAPAIRRGEPGDLEDRAADLEGAGFLQELELQADGNTGGLGELGGFLEAGPENAAAESLRGRVDQRKGKAGYGFCPAGAGGGGVGSG
jgi:hypothetical protein